MYKVLITTSGIGQKLGEITNYTNNALVRIGKKPALSYIIDSYPKNISFVITLGYFGSHIKDFIKLVYPDRKVSFIEVDKYQGKGSSLGYSMLKARHLLRCPFIYHASDTIVNEKIPSPLKGNWIGGYRSSNSTNYASFNVLKGKVRNINDKGALDYDYLHIGLVGIYDHQQYWDTLFRLYKKDPNFSGLNDSLVMNQMFKDEVEFSMQEFNTWFDTGNVEGLNHARVNTFDRFDNLDKVDESIYLFDKFVVKFYSDEDKVKQKCKRAKKLGNLVPKLEAKKKNFYRYRYSKGERYSKVVTPSDFEQFLLWSSKKLWKPKKKYNQDKFRKACYSFYHTKTKQRIRKFLKDNKIRDTKDTINGEKVPSTKDLLDKVDFKELSRTEPYQIHGDLILENIVKKKRGYSLVDWRENFGGLVEVGDIYYDFGKLNHNLTVSHDIVYKDMFHIDNQGGEIICDIFRKQNHVYCQSVLDKYLKDNDFDYDKVKLITSIIWLNMSPLHHYPFNIFLYYFGKYNLYIQLYK